MRKWLPVRGGALVPWDTLMQGVEWVYDRAVDGVPGLDGAEELAAHYRERHPTPDEAIAALIRDQTGKAGLAGFVTGCGGFTAPPIPIPGHPVSAGLIQLRLLAAIAHLRGHDTRRTEGRTMGLGCPSGSEAPR